MLGVVALRCVTMGDARQERTSSLSGDGDKKEISCDVAVVGAGAAGLMAAIFAGRSGAEKVIAMDSAGSLGAKILVAGGGRCNVTHFEVSADDYVSSTGSKNSIRNVLRRFTVAETLAFFDELGVELKREGTGKMFPVTDRARTVLDGLLGAANDAGVEILTSHVVESLDFVEGVGFLIGVPGREKRVVAKRVILATGGKALPKSGSDGGGYLLAKSLGHSLTAEVFPALVPLTLPQGYFLCGLQGIASRGTLGVYAGSGKKLFETTDDFLCTHFGLSGPGVLDVSRHFRAAGFGDGGVELRLNFLPGVLFGEFDGVLQQGGGGVAVKELAHRYEMPERLVRGIFDFAGVEDGEVARLRRDDRKRLARAFTELVLPIAGQRGFKFAEVTAGGVPLNEVNLKTMESKMQPGLFLCGEILDVDGRIGGFNFQWAWSTGVIAGRSV